MVKTREEKQKCIQVAKQIISADGEQLGILAVQMNMDLINSAIAERGRKYGSSVQ